MPPTFLRSCLQILLPAVGVLLSALSATSVRAQTTQIQYLSGQDKDNTVNWNFKVNAGRNANIQTTIPVPSNWELQGFGTYSYFTRPSSPATALYNTSFTIPASWAGQRIVLVFEGAMTDTSVKVNGTAANLTLDGVTGGTVHQGGFYRFQYDLTGLVKASQTNTLDVTVSEDSTNTSVNSAERQADYWNFSGIYRPVYLEAFPAQSIDRVAINAKADGSFNMDAYGVGLTTATTMEAQIQDLMGNSIGPLFTAAVGSDTAKVHLSTLIGSPRLWSAETPNLYQVSVRLKQGTTVLHQMVQKFGFRTMELRAGDGFYVNGARVLLKGCNRHSFWPDSGRCLSETISRQDILLMKDMNMNAVRMSHYPPDQHFLDDCDQLGLYVLDELGGWQHAYDTTVGSQLVKEMVVRDVNHPSILIWDNGNEGGWNTAVESQYAAWDPQARPVNHPQTGGLSNPSAYNNILDAHYQSYSMTQTYTARNAIYMPTEFLHGLYDGGAGAGLSDYWDLIRTSKVRGGGFIWSFLDEGVRRADQTGHPLDTSGNSAPDGIVGPYRQPEASYDTIKEVWSPIVFTDTAAPTTSPVTLHIANRYDFTDLQKCSFVWELRRFARPRDASTDYDVLAQGTATTPSIAAGTSGTLSFSLPSGWQTADALAVHALDPTGHDVWTKVWPLPTADSFRTITTPPSRLPVSLVEADTTLQARVGDLSVTFSKTTGLLTSVVRGGHPYALTNGPRLVTGTTGMPTVTHQASDGDQVITVSYATGNLNSVTWRVQRSGWLKVSWSYTLTGAQNFFGVGFDYPEVNVQSLRWLGDGPYRTYQNRRAGATTSVWQNTYNNVVTGVLTDDSPSYPEFKGYFGNVRWAQLGTMQGQITAILGTDSAFLQVFTPALPTFSVGSASVPYPSASLSILDAIPAIGSKFAAANTTGPQGNQAVAAGNYQGSVSFYFGPLP